MLVSAKLSNNLWHGLKHVFLESGILNINDYKIKISIKFENCWQFSKFWRYQNFSQDSFPYVKLNKHIHLVSIKMCFSFNMFNKSCLGINFLWLSVNILFICVLYTWIPRLMKDCFTSETWSWLEKFMKLLYKNHFCRLSKDYWNLKLSRIKSQNHSRTFWDILYVLSSFEFSWKL